MTTLFHQRVFVTAFLGFVALGLAIGARGAGAQQSTPVQQPLSVDGLVLRDMPDALKPAIAQYWKRDGQFKSRLTLPANASFPERSALGKRQRLERSLFALFDIPNSGEQAAQFLNEVSILYEWEGMASSALQEAKSALAFVKRHPGSSLEPFAHFFIAHRYACSNEMPSRDIDDSVKREITQGIQNELALARRTTNPLLTFIVEDFASRPRCSDDTGKSR